MSFMFAALLVAAQQPAPVPAPSSPAPQERDIVVTGQGPVSVREAREHVNAIVTTSEGRIARFHSPVCPAVIGMEPRYADAVAARIREVAAAAGVNTEPPGCRPNMALVVTPNGRQFVERFRAARPQMFSRLEPREVRRLLAEDEPVRVWTNTDVFNEEGQAATGTPGSPARQMRVYTASILLESTQLATLNSVVVIEDAAADGKSLAQLADYAVMRTLGGARPPDSTQFSRGTILSLFDEGADAPQTLTEMDAAFLSALYRSNALQTSTRQAAQMSRLIVRSAAASPEPAESSSPAP